MQKTLSKHASSFAVLLLVAILSPAALGADDCSNENTGIPFSTPTSDFVPGDNNTATHLTTGLVWDRDFVVTGNWSQVLTDIKQKNTDSYKGFNDWRLPNVKELESIVEYRCWSPAFNTTVFPDAATRTGLWSSTVWNYEATKAFVVIVESGLIQEKAKTLFYGAILVRGGQLFDSFNAQFPQWLLSVNKVGSGNGAVTAIGGPCTLDADGRCLVEPGSSLSLNAVAAEGSVFLGWADASGAVPSSCNGKVANCDVTAISANGSVSAIFVPLDVFDNGFESAGAD